MRARKYILLSVAIQTLILIFYSHAYSFDFTLKSKIQTELDSNPFLKEQKIKLQVENEENGYVKIKILEGNSNIRKIVNKGTDIFGPEYEGRNILLGSSESEKKSVNALKKSIDYVKKMDGVKEVMLTASVNTQQDQAEELNTRATEASQKKDYKLAVQLYQEAIEKGSVDAADNLSTAYYKGQGVPQNFEKSFELIKMAAQAGGAHAQGNLANAYYNGSLGVKIDEKKAAEWAQKAVDQGHIYSYYTLALLFERGNGGLTQDKNRADELYRKYLEYSRNKAEKEGKGDPLLARMYAFGRGTAQDYNEAIKWYDKSQDFVKKMFYITCQDSKIRECKSYLEPLLKRGDKKHEYYYLYVLDASIYACNGLFETAINSQKEAIEVVGVSETS